MGTVVNAENFMTAFCKRSADSAFRTWARNTRLAHVYRHLKRLHRDPYQGVMEWAWNDFSRRFMGTYSRVKDKLWAYIAASGVFIVFVAVSSLIYAYMMVQLHLS